MKPLELFGARILLPTLIATAATSMAEAQTSTSIVGRDDLFRPVAGAWTGLLTDYGVSIHTRDVNGQTPFVDTPSYSTGIVALGELEGSEGTFLGMIHGTALPGDPLLPVQFTRTLHQPLAVRTRVHPTAPGLGSITGFPFNGRWELLVPWSATYDFEAEVGILHTPADIAAHFVYEGVTTDVGNARVGAVLKTKEEYLGSQGLIVRIACEGHGFASRPDARLVHFADSDGAMAIASPARVRVVSWTQEQAFVFVENTLGEGENVILLSPSTDGTSAVQDPASKLESVRTNSLHDVLTGIGLLPPIESGGDSAITDCNPPKPAPPPNMDGCTPESPNDTWNHFFFGYCEWTLIGSGCFTQTAESSKVSCGPPGGTTGRRVAHTMGGSLSIGGTILGVEVSAEGSYEVETESTEGYTFQEGNGCGQCWGLFTHSRVCFSLWQGWGHQYEPHPYGIGIGGVQVVSFCTVPTGHKLTVCVGETSDSATTCNRTCN